MLSVPFWAIFRTLRLVFVAAVPAVCASPREREAAKSRRLAGLGFQLVAERYRVPELVVILLTRAFFGPNFVALFLRQLGQPFRRPLFGLLR